MTRGKYATRKDANHSIPRDFLKWRCGGFSVAPREVRGTTLAYTANYRGVPLLLLDTSAFGGVFTDYLLLHPRGAVWVEVKTPEERRTADEGLTDGEAWMRENSPIPFFVVSSEDEFEAALDSIVSSNPGDIARQLREMFEQNGGV